MTSSADSASGPDSRAVVEGVARVVAVDGRLAWLEPEHTSGCGSCHSATLCGVQPGSRRLLARRFSLPNDHGLAVGERVVVGVSETTLLRASLTAYGLPLLTMLGAGVATQKLGGGDGLAAAATLGGLLAGLLLVRFRTQRSNARGELTPHFIRRAFGPVTGSECHGKEG